MSAAASTPYYQNPPVYEVVCGVTFKPLTAFLAPHIGLYWNNIRSEFPICQEVEPLMRVIDTQPAQEMTIDFSTIPNTPRIWFTSKDLNRIIQIQRDRFLHNWRKVRATDEYPRYSKLKELFDTQYTDFRRFLELNSLGQIHVEQLELTYINHIPFGQALANISEIGNLLPDFSWRPQRKFLPNPEQVNWRTSFLLPNNAGRLHVTIQNAQRRHDMAEVIVLELTARGMAVDQSHDSMWQWFDMARNWITNGFADLTGEKVQQDVWTRKK